MSEARFAESRRDLRRRKWKRIVLAVLLVAVLGGLVWLVGFSRVLAVDSVSIKGETSLRAAQIRDRADVRIGQPLVRVDTVAIESRIASMARVEDVSVSRSWPQTLTITVVERKAIAYVKGAGTIRGVDRFGVDFRTFSRAPDGLMEAKVEVAVPRRRQQALEAVASVAEAIRAKDPDLRRQVQAISALSKDSIELNLTKGRTVVWGSEADAARKLAVLEPLLRLDATRYDVSAPDQPTTTA